MDFDTVNTYDANVDILAVKLAEGVSIKDERILDSNVVL